MSYDPGCSLAIGLPRNTAYCQWARRGAAVLVTLLALIVTPQVQSASLVEGDNAASEATDGYFTRSLTVHNVDLEWLLKRLKSWGVRLPVAGSGNVTAKFTLHVPWRHPLTSKLYRLDGTISSKRLILEGTELRDALADATYAGGVLRLNNARFKLWDQANQQLGGVFSGQANLQVSPSGSLTSRLLVDQFDLGQLGHWLPNLPGKISGLVSGNLETRVPYRQIRQLDAWQASGSIAATGVRAAGLPPAEGKATFSVQQGVASLNDLTLSMGALHVAVAGEINGHAPYAFQIEVQKASGTLGEIVSLAKNRGFEIATTVAGRFALAGTVEGKLQTLDWKAQVFAHLTELLLDSARVDEVQATARVTPHAIEMTNARASLYGGQVTANLVLPFKPEQSVSGNARWSQLDLHSVCADIVPGKLTVHGLSRGRARWRIPAGELTSSHNWQVDGNTSIDGLAVSGIQLGRLTGSFNLHDQSLIVSPLRISIGTTNLVAAARVQAHEPFATAANFQLQAFDLATLGSLLPQPLKDIRGRLSLSGHADVAPLTQQIKLTGTGALVDASVAKLRVSSASFGFGLSRFGVAVTSLVASAYGGSIRGSFTFPFTSAISGAASFRWQQVAVGDIVADMQLLGPLQNDLSASASGNLVASLPPGRALDWSKVVGTGSLAMRDMRGFGLKGGQLFTAMRIENQLLQLERFEARLPGTRVSGNLQLELAQPFRYSGQVHSSGDLQRLADSSHLKANSKLTGKITMEAKARGTLDPLVVESRGEAQMVNANLGGARIGNARLAFTSDRDHLRITRLSADLYGGSVTGTAKIPLDSEQAGEGQLSVSELDVGHLATQVVQLPFQVTAVAAADVKVRVPAGALRAPDRWTAAVKVDVPKVAINGAEVGRLRARATVNHKHLKYTAKGTVLGGLISMHGRWNADRHDNLPNTGAVELTRLDLSRIAPAFPTSRRLRGLRGTVDIRLPFELSEKVAWPTGQGHLLVSRLSWNRIALADRISGRLSLARGDLRLQQLSGSIAQGTLRGGVIFDLGHPTLSRFTTTLTNANPTQLLAPWPDAAAAIAGPVSIQLRGVLSSPWRIAGSLSFPNGTLLGLGVHDVRLPISMRFEPRNTALEMDISAGTGQIGRGRVQIKLRARSSRTLALDLQVNFIDADLQPLFLQAGGIGQLASGRSSGRLVLSGQDVRSLVDLSGSIRARLQNVQTGGLPLLQQLSPYIAGGVAGGALFDGGELQAAISAGGLILQRFILTGRRAQISATGRIEMSGALNLSVTASNFQGNSLLGAGSSALLSRVPIASGTPLGVLAEANQVLANRAVYLDVGGTVKSPWIRVRPLPLLRSEATRYLLQSGF